MTRSAGLDLHTRAFVASLVDADEQGERVRAICPRWRTCRLAGPTYPQQHGHISRVIAIRLQDGFDTGRNIAPWKNAFKRKRRSIMGFVLYRDE